jgi:hypothetical protein
MACPGCGAPLLDRTPGFGCAVNIQLFRLNSESDDRCEPGHTDCCSRSGGRVHREIWGEGPPLIRPQTTPPIWRPSPARVLPGRDQPGTEYRGKVGAFSAKHADPCRFCSIGAPRTRTRPYGRVDGQVNTFMAIPGTPSMCPAAWASFARNVGGATRSRTRTPAGIEEVPRDQVRRYEQSSGRGDSGPRCGNSRDRGPRRVSRARVRPGDVIEGIAERRPETGGWTPNFRDIGGTGVVSASSVSANERAGLALASRLPVRGVLAAARFRADAGLLVREGDRATSPR